MCLVIPSVTQSFHLLHTGLNSITLVQSGIQNGSPLNNIIDSDHHVMVDCTHITLKSNSGVTGHLCILNNKFTCTDYLNIRYCVPSLADSFFLFLTCLPRPHSGSLRLVFTSDGVGVVIRSDLIILWKQRSDSANDSDVYDQTPITKRGNVHCDCFILRPTPTIWFSPIISSSFPRIPRLQ